MEDHLRNVSNRLVEAQQQLREQQKAHEIEKVELQQQIKNLTEANHQRTQSALATDEAQESQLSVDKTNAEDFIEDYQNNEPGNSISDQILELHVQVVLTRGEASRMANDYAAMESLAEYAARLASELVDSKAMIAHCHYHRGIALYSQGKWTLASEAFQASKDCEGIWETADEINSWIQKVAEKADAEAEFPPVSRFSVAPSSAISGFFGRAGWENLGALSSAVSKSATPAISGLFEKFGWENLGGFSALGTPKTPFGSAVATTWGTNSSGQASLPLESIIARQSISYQEEDIGSEPSSPPSAAPALASQASHWRSEEQFSPTRLPSSLETSVHPELDGSGSLKSLNSRQKGHFRSTSDLTLTLDGSSDRGSSPRPESRTYSSSSIAKPPSPLRIQKLENGSSSAEASFKNDPNGRPILPLSYQESSHKAGNSASTTPAFSSGGIKAQQSKRPIGDLSTALRTLRPLQIPSSSRSSSLVTSNSNRSQEAISSPDRHPLPLRPRDPYPEFPDSSSSEESLQNRIPILPQHTQPLRVINRSSMTPALSSAAVSSDPSAISDGIPTSRGYTEHLRVVVPSTPKTLSASTSSEAMSGHLLSFPPYVAPLKTTSRGSQLPEMPSSSAISSSGPDPAWSGPESQGKPSSALVSDGEDGLATIEFPSLQTVGSKRADVRKIVWNEPMDDGEPRRLESANTTSAPEAKPENYENERSDDLSE